MIYWAQLLHFYQPPTQFPFVLDKVCRESYRPLMRIFARHPHVRATVNINACLLEMLRDQGKEDVLRSLKSLAKDGQLEFTGSGQHHPILPLIPQAEVVRQIGQNARGLRRYLGGNHHRRGFFPPEMAFSPAVASPILKAGHEWVILSGIACPAQWPVDYIPEVEVEGNKLAVFFRDDVLSNQISFRRTRGRDFLAALERHFPGQETAYVVTAMDAETFGHHIRGWEKEFLAEAYEGLIEPESRVRAVALSDLLTLFPRRPIPVPGPSSWSTTGEDLEAGNPYPLWQDKDNEVHRLQWEHLEVCLHLVREARRWAKDKAARNYVAIARGLLDQALHSDQFWWASRRPWWDINLIRKGLEEQWGVVVNAYKAISLSQAPPQVKGGFYNWVVVSRDIRNKIEERLIL